MVAGFHSLDLAALILARSAASTGSVGRRSGLGISEAQKEVVAIRGRLDSWPYCTFLVTENCRIRNCRFAHIAQMSLSGRNAVDGTIARSLLFEMILKI